MNKAFEEIRQRLSEEYNMCLKRFLKEDRDEDEYFFKIEAFVKAIEIVKEVAEEYKDRDCSKCSRRSWYQIGYADAEKKLAEEYGTDINVGSNDGWIPCSERLPRKYGEYLYTDKNGEVHEGCYASANIGMIRGWSTCDADGFVRLSDNDVIAWQPLPAPFEPKGD